MPLVLEMQISTFFQPDLMWKKQFTPLIGPLEVDRLEAKLKDLKVSGLNTQQIYYASMFPSPPSNVETEFADLLRDIGAWPTVSSSHTCANQEFAILDGR